jgi:hypothetical protein
MPAIKRRWGGRTYERHVCGSSTCCHRRCAVAALHDDQYPAALEREGARGGGGGLIGDKLDEGCAAERVGKDSRWAMSAVGATSARLGKGGVAQWWATTTVMLFGGGCVEALQWWLGQPPLLKRFPAAPRNKICRGG